MKITNEGKLGFGSLISNLGGDPNEGEGNAPHDCCSTDPPPDRALDSDAVTVNAPSSGGIVQTTVGLFHGIGAGFSESFAATPANGNTLVAILFSGEYTASVISSAGWTQIDNGVDNRNGKLGLWTKVAGAAEPTTVTVSAGGGGGTQRKLVLYEVAGSTDVFDALSHQENNNPLDGPPLTATGDGVLIAAFFNYVATYAGDPTWTPQGGLITDTFERVASTRPVAWTGHQNVVAGSYTPQLTTTPLYGGWEMTAAAIVVGSTPTAVVWNVPAPLTVDGDDATYQEIEGPDVLRVDLGGPFNVVKARILAGSEDAGPVSYTIIGGNEADLSDGVTLASLSYTATGSFTADDNEVVWLSSESYRYYELDGSDENRRIFAWELFEPDTSLGQDHSHEDLQDQIDAINTAIVTPSDDTPLVESGAGDPGVSDEVSRSDHVHPEAATGGEDVSYEGVDPSGSTETIDCSDARTWRVVLDDDCTVTLTGPVIDEAHNLTVIFVQDGTGGWTVTWPASVYWPGGVTPTLATDPGHSDIVHLLTVDGGTTWLGILDGADFDTPLPAPAGAFWPMLALTSS